MKALFALLLLTFITACSHPLEIVGEGDIMSASGDRTCLLEDFQAGEEHCSKNYAVGAYQETYYAVPREGWQFDSWGNYCLEATDNSCSFNTNAATVRSYWGETMPALEAVFTPINHGLRGFLSFGDTHPDIIEQFTLTSSDPADRGSLVETGSFTYTSAGSLSGSQSDGSKLYWSNTFLASEDVFAEGFTLQMDVEKGFFDEVGLASESLMVTDGSAVNVVLKISGGAIFKVVQAGDTKTSARFGPNAYSGTHVKTTFSFDPSEGSFGSMTVYLNDFPLFKALYTQSISGGNLYVGGRGTGGQPNPIHRIKNVMLMRKPLAYANINPRVVAVVSDSFGARGQYNNGTNEPDDPIYTGYQGSEQTELNSSNSWKNQSWFAGLHTALAAKNITPDNRIHFYGRGGAKVISADNSLSDRVDAALASTGATFPPATVAPIPGLGTDQIDIWIVHIGTNDIYVGNDPAAVLSELKLQLDRMVDDGADLITVDLVCRRYDAFGGVQEDIVETEAMNAQLATLEGYRGVVVVVDTYTDFTNQMVNDGLHPNAAGYQFIAQKIGERIPVDVP